MINYNHFILNLDFIDFIFLVVFYAVLLMNIIVLVTKNIRPILFIQLGAVFLSLYDCLVFFRQGADTGLFITLVPKVLK